MKSVAEPGTLAQLVGRMEAVRPDTARRWGTMTSAEMSAAAALIGDETEEGN